jgi:hypothetical protein
MAQYLSEEQKFVGKLMQAYTVWGRRQRSLNVIIPSANRTQEILAERASVDQIRAIVDQWAGRRVSPLGWEVRRLAELTGVREMTWMVLLER